MRNAGIDNTRENYKLKNNEFSFNSLGIYETLANFNQRSKKNAP